MMVALRCATSERVQSFVYIYSECYAIIQVIKKKNIRKLYKTKLYKKGKFLKVLMAVSRVGRSEPLGTNSHLTIPGG